MGGSATLGRDEQDLRAAGMALTWRSPRTARVNSSGEPIETAAARCAAAGENAAFSGAWKAAKAEKTDSILWTKSGILTRRWKLFSAIWLRLSVGASLARAEVAEASEAALPPPSKGS